MHGSYDVRCANKEGGLGGRSPPDVCMKAQISDPLLKSTSNATAVCGESVFKAGISWSSRHVVLLQLTMFARSTKEMHLLVLPTPYPACFTRVTIKDVEAVYLQTA